ncbi:hypothetical protein [Sphingomonas sp. PB4P5]|uniref:hypothetical protein n=1 Tax=Parasphingomonas puruogangriensis TaxID=3096155 RepID=UPI002FC8EF95
MREPYGALCSVVTAVSYDTEPGTGLVGAEVAGGWGSSFEERASRFVRGLCLPVSVERVGKRFNIAAVEHAGADKVSDQRCGNGFRHARSMA